MKSNGEIALKVNDLHKEFVLPQHRNTSVKQVVVNITQRNGKARQEVLNGISFEVRKGEFLGIVGRNGGGKSTLLKILAGVYSPTSGSVEINGGLTPFIELGVGFNPELSGRDNVFLNGALLGFSRKEMSAMYDEIVEFAELSPFMDQKLKNYSSGMQVRLAFSIAVKAENDILIFDEVLAVGDANFQEKCIRQFKKFKREGKTIILVSHSMDMIEKFCTRAILISEGNIVFDGQPEKAIDKYDALNMKNAPVALKKEEEAEKQLKIKSVDILVDGDKTTQVLQKNQGFTLRINALAKHEMRGMFVAVRICESENQFPLIGFDNKQAGYVLDVNPGDNEIDILVENNPILRGKYYIVIGVYESEDRKVSYDHYNGMQAGNSFFVKNTKDAGVVNAVVSWSKE